QVVNCARDQFLAGTRFTLDEHRRVRRCNDSNALEHGFQLRTVSNDLFEVVRNANFVFQVKLLLHEPIVGVSHLPIFQSVFYPNGNLARYLGKEPDTSLTEGILIPSAETDQTENTITADEWQDTTGFETLGDGCIMFQT